jgi:AcrR family transcriptional regulator
MENLFLEVLERSTERLIRRQRDLYEAEGPFIEKWRTAMGYLDRDFAAGYPKIVAELEALGWNRPDLRARLANRNALWRGVLTEAFTKAMAGYGLSPEQFPLEVMVALAMTFQRGIFAERLIGVQDGHDALLAWIDRWLAELEEGRTSPPSEGRCDASTRAP